ncbi:MAG: phosphoribosyltransferase family protein [Candidatus Pacebacteria bacterium]|nr:phosphoribosyltransferase family protein [Candidatus Paceibacterota bacterium]
MERDALEALYSAKTFMTGHFVYASGMHGEDYINKDAIYPHTDKISDLCRLMAEGFKREWIEVVVGPAMGGIVLSQWVAYHLSNMSGRKILSVYAEKEKGHFIFKRDYSKIVAGKNVLVVEDIINTGGTAKDIVDLVRSVDGRVFGVSAICNRGDATKESLDVPELISLVDIKLISWSPNDCPLCQKGVPVNVEFGKGRYFINGGIIPID